MPGRVATYLRSRQAGFNLGLLHRLLRLVHCDFEVRGAALTHLGHACRHLGLMLVQYCLKLSAAQAFLRGCELLLHPQKIQNPLPTRQEPCDSTHRRRGPLWSTWRICKLRLCKLRLCKFALVMPGHSVVRRSLKKQTTTQGACESLTEISASLRRLGPSALRGFGHRTAV